MATTTTFRSSLATPQGTIPIDPERYLWARSYLATFTTDELERYLLNVVTAGEFGTCPHADTALVDLLNERTW